MMNKRGNLSLFVILMIGVVCFFLAINLAYPFSQIIGIARANTNTTAGIETGLNCSTATTYQEKANCVAVDLFTPLFIGVIAGLGGMALARAFF